MDDETGKYIFAALVESRAQSVRHNRLKRMEQEEGISPDEADKSPLMDEDVITAFQLMKFCKEVIEEHSTNAKEH